MAAISKNVKIVFIAPNLFPPIPPRKPFPLPTAFSRFGGRAVTRPRGGRSRAVPVKWGKLALFYSISREGGEGIRGRVAWVRETKKGDITDS